MKIVGLRGLIRNIDGSITETEDGGFEIGRALSNIMLASGNKVFKDHFKVYELAKKIYDTNEIEVDEPDYRKIIETVNKDESYKNSLVYGQVLELLHRAEK